jgi:repressor LexA
MINYYVYKGGFQIMTEQDFFKGLGRRIQEFRKQKKLTQADISKLSGVHRSAIANFEATGEGIKSADIIRRIVEATGHSMEELFTTAEKKTSNTLCPA